MCVLCQNTYTNPKLQECRDYKSFTPSYHSKYYLERSFFQVIRMLPWSGTPAKKSQFLAHYKAVNVQKSALFDIEPCMYFFFVNYKKKLKKTL